MSEDKLHKIPLHMMEIMLEDMQCLMNELLRGALDPEKILGFIETMGCNVFRFPGSMPNKAGLSPYKVLGLDKSASDEEVKQRYRQLVHKLHPDTADMEGTEPLFSLVTSAYEQISKEREWS